MHLSDRLTMGHVKYRAGWIPAKYAIAISLAVIVLLALVFAKFNIGENNSKMIFIYELIGMIFVTGTVQIWGSTRTKYQLMMLKDFIEHQNKIINNYIADSAVTFKSDIAWHKKKLDTARNFLVKIRYGFDKPKDFEEAKYIIIENMKKASLKYSIYENCAETANLKSEEIIAEIVNETDKGKLLIINFLVEIQKIEDDK